MGEYIACKPFLHLFDAAEISTSEGHNHTLVIAHQVKNHPSIRMFASQSQFEDEIP